jgi:translation initiation factor IF-1
MEFKKTFSIKKKTPGKGRRGMTTADGVTITLNKGGEGRMQIAIRIGEKVMKSMRWLSGDAIEVEPGEVDGRKAVRLARCADGYTLSSEQGKKVKGQSVRSSLKIQFDDEIESHFKSMIGKNFIPEIKEDHLVIVDWSGF